MTNVTIGVPGHLPVGGSATRLLPRLWQGSAPPPGTSLRKPKIDVLVLTAEEYQPADSEYPGVVVRRVALDDSGVPATPKEFADAHQLANDLAQRWARGERLLVTCWMGRNRSGIVSALTIRRATGVSGAAAMQIVQAAREGALMNEWFADHLRGLGRVQPIAGWDPVQREAVRRALADAGV